METYSWDWSISLFHQPKFVKDNHSIYQLNDDIVKKAKAKQNLHHTYPHYFAFKSYECLFLGLRCTATDKITWPGTEFSMAKCLLNYILSKCKVNSWLDKCPKLAIIIYVIHIFVCVLHVKCTNSNSRNVEEYNCH